MTNKILTQEDAIKIHKKKRIENIMLLSIFFICAVVELFLLKNLVVGFMIYLSGIIIYFLCYYFDIITLQNKLILQQLQIKGRK